MKKIYAIYRVLYGEDFIQESINSIIPYVDKVFIFYDTKPWGNFDRVVYKGAEILFPFKFDNVLEKIQELDNNKIIVQYDHVDNNINQITHLVNDLIIPKYEKPDIVMFIEPDHVFEENEAKNTFDMLNSSSNAWICACTNQIELWKTKTYIVSPTRNYRFSVMFWNMSVLSEMPVTGRHANSNDVPIHRLHTHVHNFGFAVSDKTMCWKHLIALAYSRYIGDGIPNENWYEEKWLNWHPIHNNKNLEITIGREHSIKEAIPYNPKYLPKAFQ